MWCCMVRQQTLSLRPIKHAAVLWSDIVNEMQESPSPSAAAAAPTNIHQLRQQYRDRYLRQEDFDMQLAVRGQADCSSEKDATVPAHRDFVKYCFKGVSMDRDCVETQLEELQLLQKLVRLLYVGSTLPAKESEKKDTFEDVLHLYEATRRADLTDLATEAVISFVVKRAGVAKFRRCLDFAKGDEALTRELHAGLHKFGPIYARRRRADFHALETPELEWILTQISQSRAAEESDLLLLLVDWASWRPADRLEPLEERLLTLISFSQLLLADWRSLPRRVTANPHLRNCMKAFLAKFYDYAKLSFSDLTLTEPNSLPNRHVRFSRPLLYLVNSDTAPRTRRPRSTLYWAQHFAEVEETSEQWLRERIPAEPETRFQHTFYCEESRRLFLLEAAAPARLFACQLNGAHVERRWTELCRLERSTEASCLAVCGHSVFLAGGQDDKRQPVGQMWKLDLRRVEDGWSAAPALPQPRAFAQLVATAENRLVLIGGQVVGPDGKLIATNSVEALTVTSGHWSPLPEMRVARMRHAACAFEGAVFVAGGEPMWRRSSAEVLPAEGERAPERWRFLGGRMRRRHRDCILVPFANQATEKLGPQLALLNRQGEVFCNSTRTWFTYTQLCTTHFSSAAQIPQEALL